MAAQTDWYTQVTVPDSILLVRPSWTLCLGYHCTSVSWWWAPVICLACVYMYNDTRRHTHHTHIQPCMNGHTQLHTSWVLGVAMVYSNIRLMFLDEGLLSLLCWAQRHQLLYHVKANSFLLEILWVPGPCSWILYPFLCFYSPCICTWCFDSRMRLTLLVIC